METNRQYIGARYVPKFYEGTNGTEWDENNAYERLTIVTYMFNSYTSKKDVPASVGDPMHNPEYWASTGNYNAQVEEYRSDVVQYKADTDELIKSIYSTPEMYGAIGDGITDDTSALNECLADGGNIVFNKDATYLVDAEISLFPVSGSCIDLNGSTVKVKPNNNTNYDTFILRNVENVIVRNGIIVGDRDNHLSTTGSWGFGITLDNANHITIDNMSISKCWGDGIYVYGQSNDVTIIDCYLDNNRRQGISVLDATNIRIANNFISNTNGHLPESGIDVEPNDGESVTNVLIVSNIFYNNEAGVESHGALGAINNLVIADNLIVANSKTHRAIYITDTNGATVDGNTVVVTTSSDLVSIQGDGLSFTNNIFRNCTCAYGLVFKSNKSQIKNNMLENITSTKSFVDIQNCDDSSFSDNHFSHITTASDEYMFFIRGTSDSVTCDDNSINNNTLIAISCDYVFSFNAYTSNNVIKNNTIKGTYNYLAYTRTAHSSDNNLYFNDVDDANTAITGAYSGSYAGTLINNIVDGTLVE